MPQPNQALSPEYSRLNAGWAAANYLSAGQVAVAPGLWQLDDTARA